MQVDPQKYPALFDLISDSEETTLGVYVDQNRRSETEDLYGAVVASSVGDALKKARTARGISGAAAGQAVGINRQRVSQLENIEAGRIELGTVAKYLAGLGYDVQLVIKSREEPIEIIAAL